MSRRLELRTPMPWKQSVASLILRTTECCWRQGPSVYY